LNSNEFAFNPDFFPVTNSTDIHALEVSGGFLEGHPEGRIMVVVKHFLDILSPPVTLMTPLSVPVDLPEGVSHINQFSSIW